MFRVGYSLETLTQTARLLADNIGVQILGDVIVDHNRDAYRIRFRMPEDPPREYHVALVDPHACVGARSAVDAIADAIETVMRRVDEERKRVPAWSPYPVGATQ